MMNHGATTKEVAEILLKYPPHKFDLVVEWDTDDKIPQGFDPSGIHLITITNFQFHKELETMIPDINKNYVTIYNNPEGNEWTKQGDEIIVYRSFTPKDSTPAEGQPNKE